MTHNSLLRPQADAAKGPFERKKKDYFIRLGLSVRPALRLHGIEATPEEKKRIEEHCLVVAARAESLAHLLGFSPATKKALVMSGAVHDFAKMREVHRVREAQRQGLSQWDANVAAGEDAKRLLEQSTLDPEICNLMDIIGNPGIKKADDLLRLPELDEKQLASLVLHYCDAITRETAWSEPASVQDDAHTQVCNALDTRVDGLEAKAPYSGLNEEGRRYFGETTYQALRRVGHMIEKRLTAEIQARTGHRVEPRDLPIAIDNHIRSVIESFEA